MKTLRLTLAVAILALGAVAVTQAASHSSFTPKAIAGTWTGTWVNKTFGTTGSAKIVAKSLAGDTKLSFLADFGGHVFGCNDPAPEKSKVLTKGERPRSLERLRLQVEGSLERFRHSQPGLLAQLEDDQGRREEPCLRSRAQLDGERKVLGQEVLRHHQDHAVGRFARDERPQHDAEVAGAGLLPPAVAALGERQWAELGSAQTTSSSSRTR